MNPISVSELLAYTKKVLKTDYMLNHVLIKGELSEIKTASSGHMYFTIKDDKARMDCIMYRDDAEASDMDFQVGMEVEMNGSVAIYAPSGRLQFVAKTMELTGEGALYKLFLKLKDLLSKEGLFDMDKKVALPEMPKTVGVVTSTAGAALHDFLQVAANRNPAVSVIVSPTLVQGEGAGASIARAFKRLDARDDVDVILITRGGGSMEDLFCFNDETLIRTLAERRHPVVSAVGHEVDTTLCDYVADVRAATPTHGAEIIVSPREEILSTSRGRLQVMEHAIALSLHEARRRNDVLGHRLHQTVSMEAILNKRLAQKAVKERMDFRMKEAVNRHVQSLNRYGIRIKAVNLPARAARDAESLALMKQRMVRQSALAVKNARRDLAELDNRMKTMGKERVKPRVRVQNRYIRSATEVDVGDVLKVDLLDGSIAARVLSIERNGHEL
ncbi:exodeoxyribonuclease VII large subunit [Peptoniphilus sp. EMRHCC_23]|uniref:exodeoxyribonuclease VII large subunit n=1 Tax=Peptoniphilus rachelemmaiella TaxID=2811779 RepID=UPI001C008A7D|nr:exodeoxyribonuclease VII large subunit [Peptoniphilus rachelemmaiella]